MHIKHLTIGLNADQPQDTGTFFQGDTIQNPMYKTYHNNDDREPLLGKVKVGRNEHTQEYKRNGRKKAQKAQKQNFRGSNFNVLHGFGWSRKTRDNFHFDEESEPIS